MIIPTTLLITGLFTAPMSAPAKSYVAAIISQQSEKRISFTSGLQQIADQDGWVLLAEPLPTKTSLSIEEWKQIQMANSREQRLRLFAEAFEYQISADRRDTHSLMLLRKHYGTVGPGRGSLSTDATPSELLAMRQDLEKALASVPVTLPTPTIISKLVSTLTAKQLETMGKAKLPFAELSPEQQAIVHSLVISSYIGGAQAIVPFLSSLPLEDKEWNKAFMIVHKEGTGFHLDLSRTEKSAPDDLIDSLGTSDTISYSDALPVDAMDRTLPLSQWAERLPHTEPVRTARFAPAVADKPLTIISGKGVTVSYERMIYAIAELYGLSLERQAGGDLLRVHHSSLSLNDPSLSLPEQMRLCFPLSLQRAYWLDRIGQEIPADEKSQDHSPQDRLQSVPKAILSRLITLLWADREKETLTSSSEKETWSLPLPKLSSEERGLLMGIFTEQVLERGIPFLFIRSMYVARKTSLCLEDILPLHLSSAFLR